MGSWGWDKVERFKITPTVKAMVTFFQDPHSRHKKIHACLNGENTSLCNNATFLDVAVTIEQFTPPIKKLLCKNCLRLAMGLDPDKIKDQTVKLAKKTVSRKQEGPRSKRLDRVKKAVSSFNEDLMKGLDKTKPSGIEIPDEIGPEQHSLNVALAFVSAPLIALRKCAILNLDRVMNEWKKLPPDSPNQFTIIQEAQSLKNMIVAIDTIKVFPKNN